MYEYGMSKIRLVFDKIKIHKYNNKFYNHQIKYCLVETTNILFTSNLIIEISKLICDICMEKPKFIIIFQIDGVYRINTTGAFGTTDIKFCCKSDNCINFAIMKYS